jgi:hypothetical protein
MKYSLRSLMLFAEPNMGSPFGILVEFALILVGGPLLLLGIILGVRWILTHHASLVASLVSMKFTIREILMMTAMVAVVLGWFVDHWRQVSENRYLMNWKDELNIDNFHLSNELAKLQAPAPNPSKP